jgi:hypothetical protein
VFVYDVLLCGLIGLLPMLLLVLEVSQCSSWAMREKGGSGLQKDKEINLLAA